MRSLHAVGDNLCEMLGFRFSFRLFDGFCYEDWDDAIGFALVLLIRRVCFYRDIPESFSLDWIYYLSNSHCIDFTPVANFDLGVRLQIMIPKRMLWRPTLRCHEDIVISVHHSH